jgi:hypothetical protein
VPSFQVADGGTDIVVDHYTTTQSGNTITATSLHPASSSPTEAAGSERDPTRGSATTSARMKNPDPVLRENTRQNWQVRCQIELRLTTPETGCHVRRCEPSHCLTCSRTERQ